jgi:hypothetical protein
MRINSRKKSGKFSGGFGQHLSVFVNHFALKNTRMHRHECNTHIIVLSRKSNNAFSCTIFLVKKINFGKILNLSENRCLCILSIHILKLEISGCDTPV